MAALKDCPMCGEWMRLRETQTVVRVPGDAKVTSRNTSEWTCPECDYFEEAEEEEASGGGAPVSARQS